MQTAMWYAARAIAHQRLAAPSCLTTTVHLHIVY
jgi:hypothetical protein